MAVKSTRHGRAALAGAIVTILLSDGVSVWLTSDRHAASVGHTRAAASQASSSAAASHAHVPANQIVLARVSERTGRPSTVFVVRADGSAAGTSSSSDLF